jgi:hypothetical protein
MARRVVGVPRYSLYDDLRHRSDLDSDELAALTVIGNVFQDIDVAVEVNSLWWLMIHIRQGRVLHTRKVRTQDERYSNGGQPRRN